jgi:hypothetical protein
MPTSVDTFFIGSIGRSSLGATPQLTAVETRAHERSPAAGDVGVTLLFEDGGSAERTFTIAANSRFNVDVAAAFPAAAGQRFGALVESLGASPAQIVVERAMYSSADGLLWSAGTNALGTKLR